MRVRDDLNIYEQQLLEALESTYLEVTRRALLRIYEIRFGAVPEAIRARLQAAPDPETLDAWIELFGRAPREHVDQELTGEQAAR